MEAGRGRLRSIRLPLIGLNALAGSALTLAIPTILGHSLDAIVAGSGYIRWLIAAAIVIVLGIGASIVDAFLGGAFGAHTEPITPTAVAAIAQPVGSLVLLALVDPRLAAAFIGGVLLSETLTAVGVTQRGPALHSGGVVTWRMMVPAAAQASIIGPLVLVAAVGALQLADGQVTAGELLAASLYAVLGAGLCNLTGLIEEIKAVKSSSRRSRSRVSTNK